MNALENTAVIVTSDHGDNYGEHNLMGHQLCVYDTLIKVPLVIRYPTRITKGKVFHQPVGTLDLFPTILDLAGVPMEEHPVDSERRSLIAQVNGAYGDDQPPVTYSEMERPASILENKIKINPDLDTSRFDTALRCIRTDRYKYIWSEKGEDEFYDLVEDPEERTNMVDRNHPEMFKLRSTLERWMKSLEPRERADEDIASMPAIDEQIRQRLRDLGYIE